MELSNSQAVVVWSIAGGMCVLSYFYYAALVFSFVCLFAWAFIETIGGGL